MNEGEDHNERDEKRKLVVDEVFRDIHTGDLCRHVRVAGTRPHVKELAATDHAKRRERADARTHEDRVQRAHQKETKTGVRRHEDHHDLFNDEGRAEKQVRIMNMLQRFLEDTEKRA